VTAAAAAARRIGTHVGREDFRPLAGRIALFGRDDALEGFPGRGFDDSLALADDAPPRDGRAVCGRRRAVAAGGAAASTSGASEASSWIAAPVANSGSAGDIGVASSSASTTAGAGVAESPSPSASGDLDFVSSAFASAASSSPGGGGGGGSASYDDSALKTGAGGSVATTGASAVVVGGASIAASEASGESPRLMRHRTPKFSGNSRSSRLGPDETSARESSTRHSIHPVRPSPRAPARAARPP
jgi:hypothetical protein